MVFRYEVNGENNIYILNEKRKVKFANRNTSDPIGYMRAILTFQNH